MINRLVVFDCDGTIVDSQASIISAMATAFRAHGHPAPPAAAVRRVVGLPLEAAVAALAAGGLSGAEAEIVSESYRQAFRALRLAGKVDDPLYPGAAAAFAALDAAGWLLGIATGKGRRGLDQTLERHGLTGRFVTLQTADSAPGKPHPAMLLNAVAEAGADAAATIMVGDTTFDMEMSQNAGILAIGVAWGYHEAEELWAAGAHLVIDRFDDLAPALDRILEAIP